MSARAVLVPLSLALLAAGVAMPAFARQGGGAPKGAPASSGSTSPAPSNGGVPPSSDVIDFSAHIGSFSIKSPNGTVKAHGKISMKFTGTVLVVGFAGPDPVVGGSLRMEYDDPKHQRRAYFGTGTLALDGEFRAIQFFGRNFTGHWERALGITHLYGEFDDKLDTGTYQIRGQLPEAWGTGGRSFGMPFQPPAATIKPKVVDIPTRPG